MAVTQTAQAALAATLFNDTVNANAAVAVKASSATVYVIEVDNTANGAATYTKIWNTAAASVVVGTTAPDFIVMTPASVKRTLIITSGIVFGTALSVASVTAAGTAGTVSPSSSTIVNIVYA